MVCLNFKGSWRSYQKRILDDLNFHLTDNKLHVVAAPGAGKTTLGIEVISRLKRNTLILAPTNTIKNQWKDRICSAFLDEKDYGCVSVDIRKPSDITVITYQALLAAFCGKLSFDDEDVNEQDFESEDDADVDSIQSSKRFNQQKADEIITTLKKAKITLLCFDEAHHLRKEWWKALSYLVEQLQPKQTLSLTATPPYDVDYAEWQRYEELCGPIDEVISIPELVRNGDLCPHQDFIYLSGLRKNEKEIIQEHNQNVLQLLNTLKNDQVLLQSLNEMKFLKRPQDEIEHIFEYPELYVSVVSFLKFKGIKIPSKFYNLFGAKEYELPKFNLEQAKIFFNNFLFLHTDVFVGLEDKIVEYTKLAKSLKLVQNRRIAFTDSVKIERQISSSLGKLDSIKDIVKMECASLGNELRMVILADYIKADDVENNSLGVVPIWRTLKNEFKKSEISIGVLCGTLILIPNSVCGAFEKLLENYNLSSSDYSASEFEDFVKIAPKENCKNKIVSIITELFNLGKLQILVGTQALLGEGWDAPCINSLVLSSTVSSYMLSNQMRGRAIRIDKNNPNKISNIWHLASIVKFEKSLFETIFGTTTESDSDKSAEDNALWHDIEQLKKRFEGFEAPSYFEKHEIMSGISRVLNLQSFVILLKLSKNLDIVLNSLNNSTLKLAKDRPQTKKWWDDALDLGYNNKYADHSLSHGVDSDKVTMRTVCYKSYREQIIGILFCFIFLLAEMPHDFWLYVFILLFIVLFFIFLKFLRTGTVSGVMKQIAIVILETMNAQSLIKTSLKNVGLSVQKQLDSIYVSCKNLSAQENNVFIKCMQEFLDPVENPRYILIKKDKFAGIVSQTDYFAIPAVLSVNRNSVDIFEKLWRKYIGPCEIVYTRNFEGRKLLLKARRDAFSSSKRKKSRKLSKWQ